jgi:hypothetical protein
MRFLATTSLHSDDLDNSTMTSTAAPILAALRRFWAYLLPSSLVDFFAVANLDDEHYVGIGFPSVARVLWLVLHARDG